MKILLVGGGTFGHVLPGIAVAKALRAKNPKTKLLFIGSPKAGERTLVEASGIRFLGIPAGKWRRYFDLRNISDLLVTAVGFIVSIFVLIGFWPDKIFVAGGYVGFPVGLAAWLLRRPVVIHESDVVMGATNRFLSRFATAICVSFPPEAYGNLDKLVYTGLPINPVFYDAKVGDMNINLRSDKPAILITGGSQGARAVNKLVVKALPELLDHFQVIHQAGRLDYPELKSGELANRSDYHLVDVLPSTQMASAIKLASVVVSRSGSFVLEIAAVGKPAILIPLPGSANNHQYKNAQYLAERGAAILLDQESATPKDLVGAIDSLAISEKGKEMSKKMMALAKPNASEIIAELLLK